MDGSARGTLREYLNGFGCFLKKKNTCIKKYNVLGENIMDNVYVFSCILR